MRSLPVVLVVTLATVGCGSVQPKDLIGTWLMKDASRRALPTVVQRANAKIVLNADGTFAAFEVPELLSHFSGDTETATGSGRWELVSREGKQQVDLTFKQIEGWSDQLRYWTQLEVSRGRLFYFLGDPDDWRTISFEKH